jgi:DNA-binding transcriptional ArsR family regulator
MKVRESCEPSWVGVISLAADRRRPGAHWKQCRECGCRLSRIDLTAEDRLLYNHMVLEPMSYTPTASSRLDAVFAALADPTRRAILARLASGEASVMELAEPFAMSQPAISKHLRVLERAGLISRGREAQRRPRRLEAQPLAEATEWLERYRQFWEGRFQHLDALLAGMKGKQKRRTR